MGYFVKEKLQKNRQIEGSYVCKQTFKIFPKYVLYQTWWEPSNVGIFASWFTFTFLKDVGNSPGSLDDNPTATVTFTNAMNKGNKRRRSSFGRRVSFSTATKVKEFATGDKDYTLWNSTYEEERKNVSSDSSHKSDTDSEVFLAEKTFMMNDEMEMTDVLPTVQPVDPGSATRTDMTVVGSEEMEVTMAANKTMEKFSVEDTNDQVTMEITALVKPASFFAKQLLPCNSTKDDME